MKARIISAIVIGLIIIMVVYYQNGHGQGGSGKNEQIADEYYCSMHPDVIRSAPGDCPVCGMLLIIKPKTAAGNIDSALNNIVLPVNFSVQGKSRTLSPVFSSHDIYIEADGIIDFDPHQIRKISAAFSGLIERSFVKYRFQHISTGQKIYEIYCPDIYTERWNYVKLIQAFPERKDITIEALEWFSLLGLTPGQLDTLKKTPFPDYHLPVYSKYEGYAIASADSPEAAILNEGTFVEKGSTLFDMVDIKSLRAILKVPVEFASVLKGGERVVFWDQEHSERPLYGFISQIEPLNGDVFQTIRVNISDQNVPAPGTRIKARVLSGPRKGLWIPEQAVLQTGKRKYVFIRKEDRFVVTEVCTGIKFNNMVQVLSGIDSNSVIAEKASLLIDSDGFISLSPSSGNQQAFMPEESHGENNLKLSDAMVQLANIQVSEVREGVLGQNILLTGELKINEMKTSIISARTSGRIEKLFFRDTGETIKKGDKLFEFYSEDLLDAQKEYFTLQSNNWNYSGKYQPSLVLKDRLLYLGMLSSQISRLEQDGRVSFRITIFSRAGGKIRSLNIREGQYVVAGQPMFELADDSSLWLEARVYPHDATFIKPGLPAIAIIPSYGETPLLTNISYISPELQDNFRIVRSELNNTDGRLHPGMLAQLQVRLPGQQGFIVPASALVDGPSGERVWIMDGHASFHAAYVTTGLQSGDSVVILSGVRKNDLIVTSGAYLLNSEYILGNGEDQVRSDIHEFKLGTIQK